MKFMKKLMAVLIAGALAATVLTGCGSDKNTVTTEKIADALNQYVAAAGVERTYSADGKLDTRAEKIANIIEETAKNQDFSGMNEEQIYEAVMKNAGSKIAEVVSDVPKAVYGDESKPLMMLSATDVPANVKDEATLSAFYAAQLRYAAPTALNAPANFNSEALDSKWTMGTATCTVGNYKVLVVIYTAGLKA